MPSRRYQDPLTIAIAMALLPLPLLWCRFHRHPTPERQEAIPTHPLFSCSVHRNPPNQEQSQIKKHSHLILVDLIKTFAVKTSWEKHLLVGKRVPTHACRQDARTCSTKNLLSSSNSLSPAPPFLCQRTTPPFRDRRHSSYSGSPSSGPNRVRLVSCNSRSCRGTARGFISRSAGLDSEVTYWNLTAPFICSS